MGDRATKEKNPGRQCDFHKASARGSAPAGLHESKNGLGADIFVFKALQDSTAAATGQDTIYDFPRGRATRST